MLQYNNTTTITPKTLIQNNHYSIISRSSYSKSLMCINYNYMLITCHWRQYKYSQHSVHDAYNVNKSNLERPQPDTGYIA